MAHIVETIVGDRRLQLGNEAYVRLMRIGPYWQKIRIGIRLSVNGRAGIDNGTLHAGFCVDQNSSTQADRSNGCFGFCAGQAGTTDWVFYAAQLQNSYYYLGQNPIYAVSKLDNTLSYTVLSQGSQQGYLPATPGTPHMVAATFTRSGTTITISDTWYVNTQALVQAGISVHNFYLNMENENGTGVTNVDRSTHSQTVITSGADFPYAFVKWSHSTPTIEITHIAVTKFY